MFNFVGVFDFYFKLLFGSNIKLKLSIETFLLVAPELKKLIVLSVVFLSVYRYVFTHRGHTNILIVIQFGMWLRIHGMSRQF